MTRHCEDWIKTYLDYSKDSEAPDEFHFWTAVSTIAGALRRRVWFDMGHFLWAPNFYIIFVAPAGIVSKTTTASIGMRLLKQIDGISFGPNSLTWQSLLSALEEANVELENPKDGQFYPMSPMTIFSGEMGTLMDPRNREMVDILVELWDSPTGAWKRTTKTSGSTEIINPCLNLLACTTPEWISGNFPEYMIGGGFTSRCIFVYAEKKRHLKAYTDQIDMGAKEEQEKMLVEDLEQIAGLAGKFKLTEAGRKFGTKLYEEIYEENRKDLSSARFNSYFARKQSQLHKLAMVLSVAKNNDLYIGEEELYIANEIMKSIEKVLPFVFDKIGKGEIAQFADEIVGIIANEGVITKEELFKKVFKTMSFEEFEQTIANAKLARLIEVTKLNDNKQYYKMVAK